MTKTFVLRYSQITSPDVVQSIKAFSKTTGLEPNVITEAVQEQSKPLKGKIYLFNT